VPPQGKTHPIIIVIIPFDPRLPNNPARHSVMAPSTGSPIYLVKRCVCHWGPECMSLKKLLVEAEDVLLTKMIRIAPGNSETCIALRSAVSEAVSSASPLRLIQQSAPVASSPGLTPSASTYQNYIRERQQKFNEKRSSHPNFLDAFWQLANFYKNFEVIECATAPKVFLYPCRGDPGSIFCLKYGLRQRRLSTAVFCDNCTHRETRIRRNETAHQKVKLDDTDGKRTATDSRISFKSLSPGETKVRMGNLANDRKIFRFSTGILRDALASSKAKFKFLECGSGLRSLIRLLRLLKHFQILTL
jgi:hypothetical protein